MKERCKSRAVHRTEKWDRILKSWLPRQPNSSSQRGHDFQRYPEIRREAGGLEELPQLVWNIGNRSVQTSQCTWRPLRDHMYSQLQNLHRRNQMETGHLHNKTSSIHKATNTRTFRSLQFQFTRTHHEQPQDLRYDDLLW